MRIRRSKCEEQRTPSVQLTHSGETSRRSQVLLFRTSGIALADAPVRGLLLTPACS
jgi:hypothetical protein